MRLAVTLITQETDTFNPVHATLDDFEACGLYRGSELLERLRGIGMVGGFLAAIEDAGDDIELVPLIKARAVSGGRLSAETLSALTGEMTRRLRDAGTLDGFGLLMHGACAAEDVDDVEAHLLTAARAIVGDDLPVVVGLDHHANVTSRMVESATAIVGHRTQPHDPFDTGRLSGELLLRIVRGEVAPVTSWRKLRLLSHQEQYLTAAGPMRVWFDRARELEADPRVLQVSNFPMQPWLDVAEGGWSTVVVTDGDQDLADRLADELADLAWSLRHEFQITTSVPPEDAVAGAAATPGLVLLSDTGDSVFGGAGGDSTVLLAELLRAGAPTALVPLVDARAAGRCHDAGVGATVELALGGTVTGMFDPVEVTGVVREVGDPVLRLGDSYPEAEIAMGRSVVLDVDNVTLVISERPGVAGNHPGLYQALGVDPADFGAAVLKTASNFQYFRDLTTEVIRVDTPGPTQSDIASLPWKRVPRPIFPLDDIDDWR